MKTLFRVLKEITLAIIVLLFLIAYAILNLPLLVPCIVLAALGLKGPLALLMFPIKEVATDFIFWVEHD